MNVVLPSFPIYPETLPCPSVIDFTAQIDMGVRKSAMTIFNDSRRVYTTAPTQVSLKWIMPVGKLQDFFDFADKVGQGQWFVMDLLSQYNGGMKERNWLQFADAFEQKFTNNGFVEVVASCFFYRGEST
jgi:hypothetical protein